MRSSFYWATQGKHIKAVRKGTGMTRDTQIGVAWAYKKSHSTEW